MARQQVKIVHRCLPPVIGIHERKIHYPPFSFLKGQSLVYIALHNLYIVQTQLLPTSLRYIRQSLTPFKRPHICPTVSTGKVRCRHAKARSQLNNRFRLQHIHQPEQHLRLSHRLQRPPGNLTHPPQLSALSSYSVISYPHFLSASEQFSAQRLDFIVAIVPPRLGKDCARDIKEVRRVNTISLRVPRPKVKTCV